MKSEKAEAETKRDDAKEFKERYVKNIPFYEEKLKEAQRLKNEAIKILENVEAKLAQQQERIRQFEEEVVEAKAVESAVQTSLGIAEKVK